MLNPMTPIVRPNRVTLRLTTTGTKTNFRLPFPSGWWAWTMIGGGGGSGATHISYADPSEHGFNATFRSAGFVYRRVTTNGQISSMIIGVKGSGGTVTNDSDVAAQRGKIGTASSWTDLGGTNTSNPGDGGRCAFESTSLSPTQPSAPYTINYDSRAISSSAGWLTYLGCVHDGGGVTSTNAGRGAVGVTTPGVAGNDGNDGRADWYFYN